MKISLAWVADFVTLPADLVPQRIADELTLKTVEVEAVHHVDGDAVLEVDNKSLTNRPDLWGHYGVARELAAMFDVPLRPLPAATLPPAMDGLVGDLDPTLCAGFSAVAFTIGDPTAGTPEWIRRRLCSVGESSGQLCVDLSNYVMLTVGQPTHVYDAEHLHLPLSVRPADGKPVTLLNGKIVQPDAPAPVIYDTVCSVALAGVMGSNDSAVRPTTTRFVLEAASFGARAVRRSAQLNGLRTDASARYEKAIDTQRVDAAVGYFLHLLTEAAPAARADGMQRVVVEETARNEIRVERQFLADRIGTELPTADVTGRLERLGFDVVVDEDGFDVVAPSWRSTGDVSLPHDILEEVARLHGYDALPIAPVVVTLDRVRSLHTRSLARLVREQLGTRARLREVINYPWTPDRRLAAFLIDKSATVRFDEAPGPDLDSLRPSLLPNLLAAVAQNLPYFSELKVFEVGVVFASRGAQADSGPPQTDAGELLPWQHQSLAVVLTGDDGPLLLRQAKGLIDLIRRTCFVTELCAAPGGVYPPWAEPRAALAVSADGRQIGTVALTRVPVLHAMGVSAPRVACIEIDLDALTTEASRDNGYDPVLPWPDAAFDLSVVLADGVTWQQVGEVVRGADPLVHDVRYVGEYRGGWVADGARSLSLSITLRPTDHTLTPAETSRSREVVLDRLSNELGATLRATGA